MKTKTLNSFPTQIISETIHQLWVSFTRMNASMSKRYEEIMVNSFPGEDSTFINKWGIDMVTIDICIAVEDFETNITNNLTTGLELK